ncbi:MAG: hypothetical protein Q9214_002513 [Letrouitia sp. 1 TL-2023]
MSKKSYVGQRMSYDGDLCTTCFLGEVNDRSGAWIGVEWDNPGRGKHNGTHSGKKYFECRNKSSTAGSFIKHSRRADASQSFLDSLRKKYSLAVEGGEPFNQKSISISGKIVEEVGFEKIEKQLSNLSQLRVVLLNGLCIAGLEAQPFLSFDFAQKSVQSIIALDLHIVELDLSKNLLEDFADVVGICYALQQTLKVLTLNLFRPRLKSPFTSPEKLAELFAPFKMHNLRSLSLCANQLSTPDTPVPGLSSSPLSILNLSSNHISSLDFLAMLQATDATSTPTLETLILRSNPITTLDSSKASFSLPSIQTLDLSYTLLPSLQTLDPLPRLFPALKSLLISNTPLTTNNKNNNNNLTSSPAIIARIASLTSLNHSAVTPAVRQNAELAYLNSIASEIVAAPTLEAKDRIRGVMNPRFAELCANYGEPDILSRSTTATEVAVATEEEGGDGKNVFPPRSLGARLLVCNFYMEDKAEAGGMIRRTREVPKTVDIYRLKGIAGRLFGMNPVRFSLVWERDERLGSPDRVDDDEAVAAAVGAADRDERTNNAAAIYNTRSVSLREGSQEIGFYIEDKEACIRVKPTIS